MEFKMVEQAPLKTFKIQSAACELRTEEAKGLATEAKGLANDAKRCGD